MFTSQQLFDSSVNHLRKQAKKAQISYGTRCVYRGPNGLMCAVGCLIPDNLYSPDFENKTVRTLFNDCSCIRYYFGENNENLLDKLQEIHDICKVQNWEEEWENLANNFGLKYEKGVENDNSGIS